MMETSESTECKGNVYRGVNERFMGKHGPTLRISLRFLKRKSCVGCPKCAWVHDYLHEDLIDGYLEGIEDVKDGKLYKVVGTGDEDEFHLKFVEVKDEPEKTIR